MDEKWEAEFDKACNTPMSETNSIFATKHPIAEDCVVTRETILCLAVCSRVGEAETAIWAHGRLCGTSCGWQLSERVEQGIQCEAYPDRKHYVFDC